VWTAGALLLGESASTLDTDVVRALAEGDAGVIEMLGVVETTGTETAEADG